MTINSTQLKAITLEKTMGSLRVESKYIENMESAIDKFNSNNIVKLNIQGFRRLSYKILANMILNDERLPLEFGN